MRARCPRASGRSVLNSRAIRRTRRSNPSQARRLLGAHRCSGSSQLGACVWDFLQGGKGWDSASTLRNVGVKKIISSLLFPSSLPPPHPLSLIPFLAAMSRARALPCSSGPRSAPLSAVGIGCRLPLARPAYRSKRRSTPASRVAGDRPSRIEGAMIAGRGGWPRGRWQPTSARRPLSPAAARGGPTRRGRVERPSVSVRAAPRRCDPCRMFATGGWPIQSIR